jgi:hypothetical protein
MGDQKQGKERRRRRRSEIRRRRMGVSTHINEGTRGSYTCTFVATWATRETLVEKVKVSVL